MENNNIIYCDKVVSGTGIRNTFDRLIKNNENSIYNELLKEIPPSTKHIYCFVKLKGESR